MLCLFLTSCSKEDIIENDTITYDVDLTLAGKNDHEMSGKILSLINEHRNSMGLSGLKLDTDYVSALAVEHTQYMISKGNISHDNFNYRSSVVKHFDNAKKVSENVALGYDTAEKVVFAWLQSPGHKAIIEGDFSHTGFGVLTTEKDLSYFTQIFYKK